MSDYWAEIENDHSVMGSELFLEKCIPRKRVEREFRTEKRSPFTQYPIWHFEAVNTDGGDEGW
jgi:hypothetical protein